LYCIFRFKFCADESETENQFENQFENFAFSIPSSVRSSVDWTIQTPDPYRRIWPESEQTPNDQRNSDFTNVPIISLENDDLAPPSYQDLFGETENVRDSPPSYQLSKTL